MASFVRSPRARLLGFLLLAVAAFALLRRDPEPAPPPAERLAWLARLSETPLESRPDLLLVVYDARRRDDFSFGPHGSSRNDTPFLDAFARQAAVFEDAIAPGSWTVPVHAAMFTGLSVCDLGIDHYNPGFAALRPDVLTLAEILTLAGYQTIAYPDHPFFYFQDPKRSLIRGFEHFNVVQDFTKYSSMTNVLTAEGKTERAERLDGMPDLEFDHVRDAIERFNRGEILAELSAEEYDTDPETGVLLPRLEPLFAESPYFEKRYGREFDALFDAERRRPYFLFLNLHMCCIGRPPDPALLSRFLLKTLMLNARKRGVPLREPEAGATNLALELDRAATELGLRASTAPNPLTQIRHYFDTRLYDASFAAVWRYLERRGLTRKAVTLVTSDHGLSFREQGEAYQSHAGMRPYEYMTRVPLVLRFPPEAPQAALHGRHSERVSLTDVFGTMVDLALGPGVYSRKLPLRGRSLVERLERHEFEPVLVSESALLPDAYREDPWTAAYSKAVYDGELKLIYAPDLIHLDGFWPNGLRLGDTDTDTDEILPQYRRLERPLSRLYDLGEDPHERSDLAGRRTTDVERLRGSVDGAWGCEALPFEGPQKPAQWEGESLGTLRALGYIQ